MIRTFYIVIIPICFISPLQAQSPENTLDILSKLEVRVNSADTTGLSSLVDQLEEEITGYIKKSWPRRPQWYKVRALQDVYDLLLQYRDFQRDMSLKDTCLTADWKPLVLDSTHQPVWNRSFNPAKYRGRAGKSNLEKNFAALLETSGNADFVFHRGLIEMDSLSFAQGKYNRTMLHTALAAIDSNANNHYTAMNANICAFRILQRHIVLVDIRSRLRVACSEVRYSLKKQWRKKSRT